MIFSNHWKPCLFGNIKIPSGSNINPPSGGLVKANFFNFLNRHYAEKKKTKRFLFNRNCGEILILTDVHSIRELSVTTGGLPL